MQYTQRKLHRSVTEMRRYSIERPNWSIAGSGRVEVGIGSDIFRFGTGVRCRAPGASSDPLPRPIDVVLELPDRHAFLELLDDVAARVVGGPAMRVCDGDRNARVTKIERTESVLDRDVVRGEPIVRFARDVRELTFCHRAIRRVFHARHRTSVVYVAHRSDEQYRRAIRIARDLRQHRGNI